MLAKLKSAAHAVTRRKGTMHAFALGGAWFFIAFSLVSLLSMTAAKWADPGGDIALYQASDGGVAHGAFALTYNGVLGLFLVMIQLLAVAAAAVISLSSKTRRRRIAHGVLIAWAALWMFNFMYLAGIEPRFDSVCQAPLMMLLFGCTTYRAARNWRQRPAGQMVLKFSIPGQQSPAGALDSLTSEDVSATPDLPEISDAMMPPQAAGRGMRSRLSSAGRLARSGFARAGLIANGTVPIVKGAANRAKPVASAARKGAAGLYGRTVRYLKDKAVLPDAKRSTAA